MRSDAMNVIRKLVLNITEKRTGEDKTSVYKARNLPERLLPNLFHWN